MSSTRRSSYIASLPGAQKLRLGCSSPVTHCYQLVLCQACMANGAPMHCPRFYPRSWINAACSVSCSAQSDPQAIVKGIYGMPSAQVGPHAVTPWQWGHWQTTVFWLYQSRGSHSGRAGSYSYHTTGFGRARCVPRPSLHIILYELQFEFCAITQMSTGGIRLSTSSRHVHVVYSSRIYGEHLRHDRLCAPLGRLCRQSLASRSQMVGLALR